MPTQWLITGMLAIALLNGDQGGEPTPTPLPAPWGLPLAGDPGPTIQDTRPPPSVPVPGAPAPSAVPPPSLTPTTEPAFEAGPVELVVRVCVDANGDNRCTLGEGVEGVPVVVVDATTGAELEHGYTDASGRSMLHVRLDKRTSLTVDVPYLAFSQTAYSAQVGVSLVLPAPVLPKELP